MAIGTFITLVTPTEGAEIRYTTDDSTPTQESTLYQSPIMISGPVIIRAKAFKAGSDESDESIFTYTIITGEPTALTIADIPASAGEEIEVPIMIANNPGIAGLVLNLNFDNSKLIPISIGSGEVFSSDDITSNLQEETDLSSLNFVSAVWSSPSNIVENGVLYTIKFKVKDDVEANTSIPLSLSLVDISNHEHSDVSVDVGVGSVNVVSFIYGDIYSDGMVNSKDIVRLAQHLALWQVNLSHQEQKAADVIADGVLNGKDATRLAQYLASWNVTLGTED